MSIHTRTGVPGFACVVALLAFGMRVPAACGENRAFEFNVDGVLPSSQGAVFIGNPAGYLETDFFSVSGGLLRQDTTQWGYINATYSVPGVFDHSQDAVLEFRAKLIKSTYWYRGGVSGLLFSADRWWEIALSDNSIFCGNDEVPFNPRDDFHVYRMVIPANQDEYQVYVDGQLVYTGLAGPFFGYEGLLRWGDASEGNAVVEWDYVRLTNHAPDTKPPVFASATFYGGSGDQVGRAVAIANGQIYVGGSAPAWSTGLLLRFAIPPGTGLPSTIDPGGNSHLVGIGASGAGVYGVGGAYPPRCGAYDLGGDTEWKALLARFDATTGAFLGCQSTNMFGYGGGETFYGVVTAEESGVPMVYAVGAGETCGWGYTSYVVYKYDGSGGFLLKASEPGVSWGACIGHSELFGATVLNDYIYGAGRKEPPVWPFYDAYKPHLVKYDPNLVNQWSAIAPEVGEFWAVTALDGYLYAVGATGTFLNPGSRACLIEKYDQSGTRLWRAIPYAGPGEDILQGVVAIGDRLFAVGYSSFGAGNYDVLILEIDPDTGDVLNTTLWGGARDDLAYGAATDGSDLYVVGTSSSFASAEGNQVGQSDAFLLRYTLNRPPVADDQSVSADWGAAKDIELTASDEDGDTLTFSIVEPPAHGTLTGDAPSLTYTSSCTYFGMDSFTFKVNDGTEDSNIATVSITVQEKCAFTGFKPPIDNAPVVNSAKAGSVIPVLWRLTDLCGAPISDPTSFKSLTSNSTTCGVFTGDPVDELETYAGSSGLQYFGDGNWQYNWKTPKNYALQCRIMVLKLLDGSAHTAYFKFK